MAVIFGSARLGDNGKATGGKAGDQSGAEVSIQPWYKHSKGWRVFRCKDSQKAELIAKNMRAACDNNNIGYNQAKRLTLYNEAEKYNFDCSKVNVKCDTDCSALVRVCLAYAGIRVANFRTTTQPSVLLTSGYFIEMVGTKYTNKEDYLKRGDILVTPVQGHTVVVLSDGALAEKSENVEIINEEVIGKYYKRGDRGNKIKKIQQMLKKYNFYKGTVDGVYGSETERAVKVFQKSMQLPENGLYDEKTHKMLLNYSSINSGRTPAAETIKAHLQITGNAVNIRAGAGTSYPILGVAYKGAIYSYTAATSGWVQILVDGHLAYVAEKYTKVID